MGNDTILTGPPRSGTTLACYLLNKTADTIALHEPMNLQMFPDRKTGLQSARSFFPEMRASLLENGTAISKVSEGMIPANPFGDTGEGGRSSIVRKGSVHFDKKLSKEFKLIIKHNAHFTFLLPELQDYFPVYIVVRNPVSTLASWNSIKAPVSKGNLKVLETLDPALYKLLDSMPDLLSRQVTLLDKIYLAFLKASKAEFIRYEDIIASKGKALACISGNASTLSEPLESRNENPLYDHQLIQSIKAGLLKHQGAYLDLYSTDSIENF